MGWGGPPARFYLFWGDIQFLSRPLPRSSKYILSSSPVDWHLFWANLVTGGVCGHVQKSEAHALRCRPQGKSSQMSSCSIQLPGLCQHEMVSGVLKKWKQCGVVQGSRGCLQAHDLPADKSCVHGRLYLNFGPITLRHFSSGLNEYAVPLKYGTSLAFPVPSRQQRGLTSSLKQGPSKLFYLTSIERLLKMLSKVFFPPRAIFRRLNSSCKWLCWNLQERQTTKRSRLLTMRPSRLVGTRDTACVRPQPSLLRWVMTLDTQSNLLGLRPSPNAFHTSRVCSEAQYRHQS